MYERVVALCHKQGLSIRQLEHRLHIGNGAVSRWKTSDPALKTLIKVADFFGLSLDELVFGTINDD